MLTRQIKYYLYFSFLLVTILSISGCSKKSALDVYNNNVFTEKLYKEITGIKFSVASEDYVITDTEKIHDIYMLLASMDLQENTTLSTKLGTSSFYLCTDDEDIMITGSGDSISFLGESYVRDDEVWEKIMEIFLEELPSEE